MLGFFVVPSGQNPGSPPSEVGYSIDGDGTWLCPFDPQYNTRGEAGMYFDTSLGGLRAPAAEYSLVGALTAALQTLSPARRATNAGRARQATRRSAGMNGIPTDAELASVYGYTPFTSGWIASKDGRYFPANWQPPSGWDPAGEYGPQISLSGPLADVTIPAGASTADTQAIVDTLNAQSDRNFKLAIVTTVVLGTAAIINSYRTWKQLKRDEAILQKMKAA
jgi:hypothetical protein